MVNKGIKVLQITAAALWTACLGVVLLLTAFQDVLIPAIYDTYDVEVARIVPVDSIVSAALCAALGIVSACIVCKSEVKHTRRKAVVLTAVYAALTLPNVIISTLSSYFISQKGIEYARGYSLLSNMITIASYLFTAVTGILFLLSLGGYFNAEKRASAAQTEAAPEAAEE